jgi:hypothetical protein
MGFKFKAPDLSRVAFFLVSVCSVIGLAFAIGLYSGAKRNSAFAFADSLQESLYIVLEEAPTLSGVQPTHFLQPARYDGTGVTLNNPTMNNGDLILLAGFFENSNELRLIRRNGDVVARWPVRFSNIFPDPGHLANPPSTDWNIDTHGALALPDGSVVFNFEYGGLVKLSRCGDVVWTLARQTHHSVERGADGSFWVPGRRQISTQEDSPFPPFETPFAEDTILKVSDNGSVLAEISVPKLFYDNGLEAVLTATGHHFSSGMEWDHEILHLNKVEILMPQIAGDFPMFAAGDLALSIYDLNLVMVVNPDNGKIEWWHVGPWLRQHDPEFVPGGKLIVFNNNAYTEAFGENIGRSPVESPRVSNVLEADLRSGGYRVVFGGNKGEELFSIFRGKVDSTPSGGLIITEFEGGRAIETDRAGNIVWEYLNRYDADEVAEITEARVYPSTYFTVTDWSCPETSS